MCSRRADPPNQRAAVGMDATGSGQLQQLVHDIRNHLGVMSLGLDGIESRAHNESVRDICQLMRTDGLEPIRSLLIQLDQAVEGGEKSDGPRNGDETSDRT